jgi:hypothetical protein
MSYASMFHSVRCRWPLLSSQVDNRCHETPPRLDYDIIVLATTRGALLCPPCFNTTPRVNLMTTWWQRRQSSSFPFRTFRQSMDNLLLWVKWLTYSILTMLMTSYSLSINAANACGSLARRQPYRMSARHPRGMALVRLLFSLPIGHSQSSNHHSSPHLESQPLACQFALGFYLFISA